MNPQILPWFRSFSFLLILITLVPQFSSNPDEFYQACGGAFSCGTVSGIGYPFRRSVDPEFCGYPGLVLHCDLDNATTIEISNMKFRVLSIDPNAQNLKIVREDMMDTICPTNLVNTTLDNELFEYLPTYMNLTFLYRCPDFINFPGISLPSCGNAGVYVFPGVPGPGNCNASVVVPVSITDSGGSFSFTDLDQAVGKGFVVRWKVDDKACRGCTGSKGHCGYDPLTNQTACFCPDPPYVSDICSAATTAPSGSSPSTGMHQ